MSVRTLTRGLVASTSSRVRRSLSENVSEFAAASAGTGYVIAYTHRPAESAYDVRAVRLSPDGGVTPLTITSNMGSQVRPGIASNASGYFAVWYDQRAGNEIWGVPLNEAGSPTAAEVRLGVAAGFEAMRAARRWCCRSESGHAF